MHGERLGDLRQRVDRARDFCPFDRANMNAAQATEMCQCFLRELLPCPFGANALGDGRAQIGSRLCRTLLGLMRQLPTPWS